MLPVLIAGWCQGRLMEGLIYSETQYGLLLDLVIRALVVVLPQVLPGPFGWPGGQTFGLKTVDLGWAGGCLVRLPQGLLWH